MGNLSGNMMPIKSDGFDVCCQKCGKPATINYQSVLMRWYVSNGKLYGELVDNYDGDINEFYCEECEEAE